MPDGFSVLNEPPADAATPMPDLRTITATDLLSINIPQREHALFPVFRCRDWQCSMRRVAGKTLVGLSIALAIASGGIALRWRAPGPRRILYLDGEMPAGQLQERLAELVRACPVLPEETALRFLASDLMPEGMPSIARTVSPESGEQACR